MTVTPSTPTTPAKRLRAVTPADTGPSWANSDNVDGTFKFAKALYVGVAGDIRVLAEGDTSPVTLVGVVGEINIRVQRVLATGTTATSIVAYF